MVLGRLIPPRAEEAAAEGAEMAPQNDVWPALDARKTEVELPSHR